MTAWAPRIVALVTLCLIASAGWHFAGTSRGQEPVAIWVVDISTFQTYGSAFVAPGEPIPPDFRYEPWESMLEMLERIWLKTEYCNVLISFVAGPGADSVIGRPCLDPGVTLAELRRHAPAGWYEFDLQLAAGVIYASALEPPGKLFVVNRGPYMPDDEASVDWLISIARYNGVQINVVPMGNEPGRRMRFPYLTPLGRLAGETGGRVYYAPDTADPHDFSMLPATIADQIILDLEAQ